jgi:hypothetical protein
VPENKNALPRLDITGVEVFEAIAALDAEAPSDCLAAYLKAQPPTVTQLTLAFPAGQMSEARVSQLQCPEGYTQR